MTEEFEERTLLHDVDLMTVCLRLAASRDTTLDDCVAEMRRILDAADEAADVGDAEIREHLETARHHLVRAGLIEPATEGAFRATADGRDALSRHPNGIDDSVLLEYPAFRDYIAELGRGRAPEQPLVPEYEDGHAAFIRGRPHTANPYRRDTARHLAWENGWFGARNELTSTPPRDG